MVSFDPPTAPVFSHEVVADSGVVVGVEGDTWFCAGDFHEKNMVSLRESILSQKSMKC